jgi:hypothetical protein
LLGIPILVLVGLRELDACRCVDWCGCGPYIVAFRSSFARLSDLLVLASQRSLDLLHGLVDDRVLLAMRRRRRTIEGSESILVTERFRRGRGRRGWRPGQLLLLLLLRRHVYCPSVDVVTAAETSVPHPRVPRLSSGVDAPVVPEWRRPVDHRHRRGRRRVGRDRGGRRPSACDDAASADPADGGVVLEKLVVERVRVANEDLPPRDGDRAAIPPHGLRLVVLALVAYALVGGAKDRRREALAV